MSKRNVWRVWCWSRGVRLWWRGAPDGEGYGPRCWAYDVDQAEVFETREAAVETLETLAEFVGIVGGVSNGAL